MTEPSQPQPGEDLPVSTEALNDLPPEPATPPAAADDTPLPPTQEES